MAGDRQHVCDAGVRENASKLFIKLIVYLVHLRATCTYLHFCLQAFCSLSSVVKTIFSKKFPCSTTKLALKMFMYKGLKTPIYIHCTSMAVISLFSCFSHSRLDRGCTLIVVDD